MVSVDEEAGTFIVADDEHELAKRDTRVMAPERGRANVSDRDLRKTISEIAGGPRQIGCLEILFG